MASYDDDRVTGVPTGNTFDKYRSANPIVRMMMAGFERAMLDLLDATGAATVLDVGCGEGVQTRRCADHRPTAAFLGVDLDDPKLAGEWRLRERTNLAFRPAEAETLPFDDLSFDAVMALEVLEHVADPEAALREIVRVSRGWLLLSVPREPAWRALNLARGAYVRALGNTPGHIQHWSKREFVRLVSRFADVERVLSPVPWTMVLARRR